MSNPVIAPAAPDAPDAPDAALDAAVLSALDAEARASGAAEALPPNLLAALADDLARGIYPAEVVARRYNLTPADLLAWLARPAFAKLVRARKAAWESDGSAQDRLRAYWTEGMIQASPALIAMMSDPSVGAAVKVDLARLAMKVAGVDNAPTVAANGAGGPGFAVNIHFSDGKQVTLSAAAPTVGEAGHLSDTPELPDMTPPAPPSPLVGRDALSPPSPLVGRDTLTVGETEP